MKKIANLIFVFFCFLELQHCSQFIYKDHGARCRPANTKLIPLDGTLYARAVTSNNYQIRVNQQFNLLSTTSPKDSIIENKSGKVHKLLLPLLSAKISTKVIEIEYLFISADCQDILYVSTVADRYQNRYSNDSTFLGLDHPNVADFRVFLFGRRNPSNQDQYIFYDRDGKHMDTWTMATDPSGNLDLALIEQKRLDALEEIYLLNDALAHTLNFVKQPNYKVMFLEKKAKNKSQAEPLLTPNIQIVQHGKNYTLLFSFQDHNITFKDKQLIYTPARNITRQ